MSKPTTLSQIQTLTTTPNLFTPFLLTITLGGLEHGAGWAEGWQETTFPQLYPWGRVGDPIPYGRVPKRRTFSDLALGQAWEAAGRAPKIIKI